MTTPLYSQGKLRLGTRSSLLAVAQTRQVATELRARYPDLSVEIIGLSSPGDRDLSTPLTAVAADDFFSADIDRALLAGEVDACVHSWKDITGERPGGLVHAATPRRAAPHDVVLFRHDIATLLAAGAPLRIGTCSLRRRLNVADFLATALPASRSREHISFVDIRGAVDVRAQRITAAAGEQRLDGIVLALAGLQRLYADPDGRAALAPALSQARWMVLPLADCPAAPAQAALAIECRADDARTRELLAGINDAQTCRLVELELRRAERLGSARDRFGITAIAMPELSHVLWERGRQRDGAIYAHVNSGPHRPRPKTPVRPWRKAGSRTQARAIPGAAVTSRHVFLAHADALQALPLSDDTRVWTSGPGSWRRLAERGVWVEGCGDNLGFEALKPLLANPLLQLAPLRDWTAVTHAAALAGWADSGVGNAIASYELPTPQADVTPEELATHNHFYWDSARQYRALEDWLPKHAQHACGAGKTLRALRADGLEQVQPFVSRQEWQEWLG